MGEFKPSAHATELPSPSGHRFGAPAGSHVEDMLDPSCACGSSALFLDSKVLRSGGQPPARGIIGVVVALFEATMAHSSAVAEGRAQPFGPEDLGWMLFYIGSAPTPAPTWAAGIGGSVRHRETADLGATTGRLASGGTGQDQQQNNFASVYFFMGS